VAGWPFVGRLAERERIGRLLLGTPPTGVLVAGEQGVGKTRLAGIAREQAQEAGFEVHHVLAGSATRAIPFGALATLLPVVRVAAESSQVALGSAAANLAALGGDKPLLISVDDAHHLDDPSAAVLHQVGADGSATILMTVRADLPMPEPVRALWRSGSAERLDLGPLRLDEIEQVLEAVLGGRPAAHAVGALARLSEGNGLYLRELVEGSLARGTLRQIGGLWHLDEPSTTPRLTEIIDERLAQLGEDARHGLELVTVAGSLGYLLLADAVGEDAVEELEVQGLITVSSDRQRRNVTVGHPIHADVVRDALSTRRSRQRHGEVADAIEARGTRRRDDVLRVAVARLEAGGAVEPELMTEAARRALGAYDLHLGERLARVAVDAGGGLRSSLALGAALARLGRQKEAERVFARIDTTGATDDDRALLAMEWADSRFWGLDDHPGAKALLMDTIAVIEDSDWKDRLLITSASYDLLMGKATDALAAVEHIREIGTPRGIAAVALVVAPALQLLGRGDEAMAALEEAVLPFDEPDAPTDAVYLGMLVVALGLVAVDLGRFADARIFAEGGHQETVTSGIVLAQAWFAMILGRTSMAEGDLVDAERWFREAATCFGQTGNRPHERLCLFSAAWALAQQGRPEQARALAEEAREIDAGHVRLQEPIILRSEAALAMAEGDRPGAIALLNDAADVSQKLELRAEELGALHDLARLGEAHEVVERVEVLAAEVDGPLAALKLRHVKAAIEADAVDLGQVADRFDDLGAGLFAAEAAAQASHAARSKGDHQLARRWAARAEELIEEVGPVATPALELRAEVVRLTDREREVAALAARRVPSKEIAAQLALSRRTVDNHLQRAYTKLGVNDRQGLAEALGIADA
jgi:DNA-binding CsgD family transcriptional regulator